MTTDHNNGKQIHSDDLPGSLKKYFEKPSPFEVPENYFEELPRNIKERIEGNQEPVILQHLKTKRMNWAAGIAASVALAVFISIYLPLAEKGKKANLTESLADLQITQSVLDDYILENTDESEIEEVLIHDPAFSPSTLPIFTMSDDTIPEVRSKAENAAAAKVIADTTLSAEDIFEYLNTEGFDPEDE